MQIGFGPRVFFFIDDNDAWEEFDDVSKLFHSNGPGQEGRVLEKHFAEWNFGSALVEFDSLIEIGLWSFGGIENNPMRQMERWLLDLQRRCAVGVGDESDFPRAFAFAPVLHPTEEHEVEHNCDHSSDASVAKETVFSVFLHVAIFGNRRAKESESANLLGGPCHFDHGYVLKVLSQRTLLLGHAVVGVMKSSEIWRWIVVIAGLWTTTGAFAQGGLTNPPPLMEVSPGVYQIGLVQLDKSNKSVQFPAVLNMDHGLIEYLLVTTRGKTHESLLKTEAEPYHIHVAMLLLGAKGAAQTKELLNVPTGEYHVNTPGAATNRLAALLKGDPIRIELVWTNANGARGATHPTVSTNAAEDWITDLQTGKSAARGTWDYNGSRVVDGIYMAQQQGSIVAVIDDVDAMVNNPRKGHENDQVWEVRTNTVPKLNGKVLVRFKLGSKVRN